MHPELYLDLYHQERADLDRRLHERLRATQSPARTRTTAARAAAAVERARRAVRSALGPQPAPVAGVVCCTT